MPTKAAANRPKRPLRVKTTMLRRRVEDLRGARAARTVIERREEEGTVAWSQIKTERGL